MTRVTFCIVEDEQEASRKKLSCSLASEICYRRNRSHILTSDEEYSKAIDELLWEYPEDRFVPHEVGIEPSTACLVTIDHRCPAQNSDTTLVNTTQDIPANAEEFQEIFEVFLHSERQHAREIYRAYREKSFELDFKLLSPADLHASAVFLESV